MRHQVVLERRSQPLAVLDEDRADGLGGELDGVLVGDQGAADEPGDRPVGRGIRVHVLPGEGPAEELLGLFRFLPGGQFEQGQGR